MPYCCYLFWIFIDEDNHLVTVHLNFSFTFLSFGFMFLATEEGGRNFSVCVGGEVEET